MTDFLSINYWNKRYLSQQTGWDLGQVSPPIKAYINQLENKDLKILIPGAGQAYEAIYLLEQGFTNITIVDFAEKPLSDLSLKLKNHESLHYHLINDDFFNLTGQFDLILEQTFFSAIDKSLRKSYVAQTHKLLISGGKLVGLLFGKHFPFDGPPFGGNALEYELLFKEKYLIEKMEEAYNSVKPRLGAELFIKFTKRG